MIWIVFAGLTAAVIAGLLFPALRKPSLAPPDDRNAFDRAVFKDQLSELDRDLERGVIGPAEAEAARNEIARRLIAASVAPEKPRRFSAPNLAFAATLIVPIVALPLYLKAGSPQLPDVPLAARMANAEKTGDYEALVLRVEQHLARNPDDLQGWRVLAPAYRREERWADAAEAQRNILRLSEPTAEAMADYGEALVLANEGIVPAAAYSIMAKALTLDPKLPKARFYAALALKQEGKAAEAKAAFEAFLKDTPEDAPWRPMLLAEMQDMSAKPPALDEQTMQDASQMSAQDQQAMIRSMVDGLEEKLMADGSDLSGWLRLIRARGVLGEAEKAKAAYDTAKGQFQNNPDALAQLDGLAKEMNIP